MRGQRECLQVAGEGVWAGGSGVETVGRKGLIGGPRSEKMSLQQSLEKGVGFYQVFV